MKKLTAICLFLLFILPTVQAQTSTILYAQSPLRIPIPANATYTRESRIASIRQTYVEYSGSSCRVPDGTVVPLVAVTVRGGTARQPQAIPSGCNPDGGSDAHMIIVNVETGQVNEFWQATWNANHTAITAGGNVTYALNGTGITSNANFRTTAAGLSLAVGQVRVEDLQPDCDGIIDHAITFAVPASFLNGSSTTGFVAPAVGSETAGSAGSGGLRMGDEFSIPRDVDVDSMTSISPFSRTILRTIQRYGAMIADGGGQSSGNQAIGVFRNEPNALESVCGLNSDDLIPQVQREIAAVIAQYGFFRVSGGSSTITSTPRSTATARPTGTPLTPAATSTPRPTVTVRPTSTGIGIPALGCQTFITPVPLDITVHCH